MDEGPLAELLPELLERIFCEPGLAGYGPALAQVCRRWAARAKMAGRPLTVAQLAERGHEGLLVWADTARRFPTQALCGAARGGHRHLCVRAKKEWGAGRANTSETWHALFYSAQHSGMLDAFEGVRGWKWPRSAGWRWNKGLDGPDFDEMLWAAAAAGHRELCLLARDWGAVSYDWMLVKAARGGHTELCWLARKWWLRGAGVDMSADAHADLSVGTALAVYGEMLVGAAEEGHWRACDLLGTWERWLAVGEEHAVSALIGAARGGRDDVCRLIWRQRVAGNIIRTVGFMRDAANWVLAESAERGHVELCWQAREWGATNFDWMLARAAIGGLGDMCRLAKDWGAENFEMMLQVAERKGRDHICRLAREWMGCDDVTR